MRLLFSILFLFILAEAGVCQSASAVKVQTDSTGNVSAIYPSGFDKEGNLTQTGSGNYFFFYSVQYSLNGLVRVSQSGIGNQVISVDGGQAGESGQVLIQKGSANRIGIYQAAAKDSLSQKTQTAKVKQEGSGNSVTIIRDNH